MAQKIPFALSPSARALWVTSWGILFALAFVDPGVHLALARWLVEGAVDLYRLEELSIVIEPGLLILCDLNWVEPARQSG